VFAPTSTLDLTWWAAVRVVAMPQTPPSRQWERLTDRLATLASIWTRVPEQSGYS